MCLIKHRIIKSLLVITIMAGSLTHAASAQVTKPFKLTGGGVGPTGLPLPGQPARSHWAFGEATHLGRYYGDGSIMTASADFSQFPQCITGKFGSASPFRFVAANGDVLECDYGRDALGGIDGDFKLNILEITTEGFLVVEAIWIANFIPTDHCTGRFEGVTGRWVMYAYSEPFILGASDPVGYVWDGEGSLTFPE